MGWKENHEKTEELKCRWVNICLEVKQGMRRRGIKTIPLTKAPSDDDFWGSKNRLVGADIQAVLKG